jgi:hypothetical protein
VADRVMNLPDGQLVRRPLNAPGESVCPSPLPGSFGRPLDPEALNSMEAALGFSFGHVRVHTNRVAVQSARSIGARAYAAGNHLVFDDSQYAPEGRAGRWLLAHELAHVIQQSPNGLGKLRDTLSPIAAPENSSATTETRSGSLVQRKPVTPVGGSSSVPGLSKFSFDAIEMMIAQGNWQGAIDIVLGDIVAGTADLKLLRGGRMKYDPTLTYADAATGPSPFDWKTYSPGNPIPVMLGPSAFRLASTAAEYEPNKGIEGPSISYLYVTIEHEYQHVKDAQRASNPQPGSSGDATHHVEMYHDEITSSSMSGLTKSPGLTKHVFEDQLQTYADALKKIWSGIKPETKSRLIAWYESAFKAAQLIVTKAGLTLKYDPFPTK